MMFEYFKSLVSAPANKQETLQKKIEIATCALFYEIAKADENFSDNEHDMIVSIMKEKFELADEEADKLMLLTEESIKESVSIYEFTTLLDQNFSKEEKLELMKNLWRLIYSDKKLDKYEDNLIKRIGDMLKLEHKEVIEAKLMIKGELGL
jgi:uncharacterized tellurite resistance protein B-like protein